MMTRKEYLQPRSREEQRQAHRQYYGEIAREAGIRYAPAFLERVRQALKTDERLNNIPLHEWDVFAALQRSQVAPLLKARGDSWALCGGVCTAKEAARLQAELEKGQGT